MTESLESSKKAGRKKTSPEKKKIKALERELLRKNMALAEAILDRLQERGMW